MNEVGLRKAASNCIYCYLESEDLTTKMFGRYLPYVKAKRDQQLKYIKGLCAVDFERNRDRVFAVITDEIKRIYGKAPLDVLAALSKGYTVKGLNWSEGIYGGIGDVVNPSSFGNLAIGNTNSSRYSLDTSTGICTDTITGQTIKGTPTYSLSGLSSMSYYDAENGVTLQANYKKGSYNAYSVSDGINTLKTNGKAITKLDGEFWTNVINVLGEVKELISGIASTLSGVSAQSLSPAQVADGWYAPVSEVNSGNSGSSALTTAALLGGGLLLGATILGSDGKPARKNKE